MAATTKEERQVAADLQRQCAQKCANSSKGVIELCDTAAQATFVAAGGVVGSAGILLALMANDDILMDMEGADQHNFALLAMMFAWWTDLKDRGPASNLENGLPWLVSHWEKITGKTFDPDWLYKPLAEILREAKAA